MIVDYVAVLPLSLSVCLSLSLSLFSLSLLTSTVGDLANSSRLPVRGRKRCIFVVECRDKLGKPTRNTSLLTIFDLCYHLSCATIRRCQWHHWMYINLMNPMTLLRTQSEQHSDSYNDIIQFSRCKTTRNISL